MKLVQFFVVAVALLAANCLASHAQPTSVAVCVKTGNGRYARRIVRSRRIPVIRSQGGGRIGDSVPGRRGYVFGNDCQPNLAESKCCDAAKEPGQNGNPFCIEGAACCPDGTWSCSIGDGVSFPCGGKTITSGFGEVCNSSCCKTKERPGFGNNPVCFDGFTCCADCCTWSCGIGDGTFACDSVCKSN
jgi:hypothetical protein